MLEYMRKNSNRLVVWLIMGAIAVVFIFFGVGPGGPTGQNISVNGQEVEYGDYVQAYDAIRRQLIAAQGGEFSENLDTQARAYATASVVRDLLITQFAQKQGLVPSNALVARAIGQEFQVNGQFSSARYEDYLAVNRISAVVYEDRLRQEILLNENLPRFIGALANTYPAEVAEQWHLQEDKIALDYAFFPASLYLEGLAPGDEELAAFYAANQERWREPTRLKLAYVEFKPADFLAEVEVSEGELETYYNEHSYRFIEPAEAEVSHILFRFSQANPSESEKEAALLQAKAAYDRAQTEDFAALAQELSQDPASASDGGSLGAIRRGSIFEALEAVVFNQELNSVSEPVLTPLGYHLLKVTARQDEKTPTLEELGETLSAELLAAKARQKAVDRLEDLIIRAETSPLAEAAKSMGLAAQTSEFFTQAEPLPFFEGETSAVLKAFQAPLAKVADPFEGKEHLVLFAPVEKVESNIPELATVAEEVRKAWLDAESLSLARKAAAEFLPQAVSSGWATALAPLGLTTGQTAAVSRLTLRGEAPFTSADAAELFGAIFSVSKKGEVVPLTVSGELDASPGVFVLAVADFQAAEEFTGPAEETFTAMMAMNQSQLFYLTWLQSLHQASQSEIIIPKGY